MSFNNMKSDFDNIDHAETKNDSIDENLYTEISNSNDIKLIKEKFRKIVDIKKERRKRNSKIFAIQFKYELIQIIILIILTSFVSFKLLKSKK